MRGARSRMGRLIRRAAEKRERVRTQQRTPFGSRLSPTLPSYVMRNQIWLPGNAIVTWATVFCVCFGWLGKSGPGPDWEKRTSLQRQLRSCTT